MISHPNVKYRKAKEELLRTWFMIPALTGRLDCCDFDCVSSYLLDPVIKHVPCQCCEVQREGGKGAILLRDSR